MILSLLSGIVLGIILAIPPGPVGITAIKYGLFRSPKAGTQLALGNAVMDFLFCLLAVFATSFAISTLNTLSITYPLLTLFIQFGVIIGFVAFGIMNIKTKPIKEPDYFSGEQEFRMKFLQDLKQRGIFFLGIAIAMTNIANPTFITTLAWVSVQTINHNLVANTAESKLLYALGFGLGNFLWIFGLVKAVTKYKHKLSDMMLIRIKKFAGITFLGFGTLLGWRVITLTKWTEIFHLLFAF